MSVRVFISYRHTDGRHVAGRLRDRLADAFGDENVFFDVESIAFGLDFRTVIRDTLQSVDVVLALIGPGFSPERMAQPNDVVRMELATAFELDKLVVPVLVGDAPVPSPDDLPSELEQLAFLRAAPLRDDPDFRTDVGRLVESLATTVRLRRTSSTATSSTAASATPTPPSTPRPEPQPAPYDAPPATVPAPAPPALSPGPPRLLERLHTKQVRGLAFSPDGTVLLSGGEEKTVTLWDVTSGDVRTIMREHTGWVIAVAFSPAGSVVASASIDGTVRRWNADSGAALDSLALPSSSPDQETGPEAIAFAPDGGTLLIGGHKVVHTWRPGDTVDDMRSLHTHGEGIRAVAWSPTGAVVASGGNDHTVWLGNPSTGEELRTLRHHTAAVTSVAFSPDGRLLASAGADATVRVSVVGSGELLRTFSGPSGRSTVAFSPDGTLVANGGSDSKVRLWHWATGSLVATLDSHRNVVYALAFSPDGRLLATGGGGEIFRGDHQIRLWSLTP